MGEESQSVKVGDNFARYFDRGTVFEKMSLIPFIMSDPWDEYRGSHQLLDQHFGHGINLREVHPSYSHANSVYNRPWRHVPSHRSGTSSINYDKDGFSIVMDVSHFSPEEITVKHVGNFVMIEGKHKETPDEHGWISRHFVRRYVIPDGVDGDSIQSTISTDGVLTVVAPKKRTEEDDTTRTIPITQTGKPALKLPAKHPHLSTK
ncbi:hypothetical protein J437_LFUL012995 [Ladona fulva]|uniref:SHSP domain-containing protein n=1 Tax=Ladona fulva TaxID=123851 RepID=A0A8K0KD72_LADFU|nr:hypothetical protein J437_LFUL012995 [Ladona fulva]